MSSSERPGHGRPRYLRLWRLPTIRFSLAVLGVGVLGMAGAVAVGSGRTAIAVAVVAVVILAGYTYRHRSRASVERHLIHALVRSRTLVADAPPDGVTRIRADSWLDAVRQAGFVTARDRGFQLDFMRRTAAGRLAELLGRAALPSDEHYRSAGLVAAAAVAAAELEDPERDVLRAYADGVNEAFAALGPPFESRFLSYRPQPWTVEDSTLLALYMFHTLSFDEREKRAEAVIRHTYPQAVADFLLAAEAKPVPAGLAGWRSSAEPPANLVAVDRPIAGSNCWATATANGPVLACDLHLPLTMPNLLYEMDLRWPGGMLRGLALAGLPAVLTGTNGRIAWGVTDLSADVLDLVPVDHDAVRVRTEEIRVRGGGTRRFDVSHVGDVPVARAPLLGAPVAARWTGYDPRSCDLKFVRLAHAGNVEEGMRVLDDADGIALNVLLTDTAGRLAHMVTGLIPRRRAGHDGPPDGMLRGPERPRVIDPPSRIVASANDELLLTGEFRIGYAVDPGHRADRIREVLGKLADSEQADPTAMLALQHDTAATMYEAYRDLAVSALADRRATGDREIEALLTGWDGTSSADSLSFGVLAQLRVRLAERVLAPLLVACRDHDPQFVYAPSAIDHPLLAIVRSNDPDLLPAAERADGWPGFIAGCVDDAVRTVRETGRRGRIPRWGRLNAVGLSHPLSMLARWAAPIMDVAPQPQSGTLHSVRVCVPGFGAAGRAVLTPAGTVAYFQTPGGQSGHPLSRHYRDRHRRWAGAERTTVPASPDGPISPRTSDDS
ncbi:penicillin acylase family protein [Micromonospora sp. NPDC047467]|uniref:penicillin acylase family protein n=1 Tax=Micromonospora sp. NPDC047467 TaxID=3154814 RepID=UPI0033CEC5C9